MKTDFGLVAGFGFSRLGKRIYVGNFLDNSICCIENNKVRVIKFDYELKRREWAWAKTEIIGSKVIFVPCDGNEICVLDDDTGRKESIQLDVDDDNVYNGYKFWETAVFGDNLYIMGIWYPAVIKFNARSNNVKYLWKYCEQLYDNSSDIDKQYRYYFADGHVSYQDDLYFAIGRDSSLFRLTPSDDEYEIINTGSGISKILSISNNGDDIWMTDRYSETGRISIWNINTRKAQDYTLPSEGLWNAPVFYDQYAYFFPMTNEGKIYKVDTTTMECELFKQLDVLLIESDYDGNECRNASVMMARIEGNIITFIRRPDYTWFTYNFETGELTSAVYEITDEEYLKALEKDYYDQKYDNCVNDNQVVSEEEMPLVEYLKRVAL